MKYFYQLILILSTCTAFIACQESKKVNTTFDTFILDLGEAVIGNRPAMVEDYLSLIESTPIIESEGNVHHVWYGKADTVKIQGDLQGGWSKPETLTKIPCGEFNLFYTSYNLPSDAQLEYQYLVDGNVELDSRNPNVVQHLEYGERNDFRMPDFERSPYLDFRKDALKGIITHKVFKSQNSEFADRNLEVYLPSGYNEEDSYPVLLVNDGKVKLYSTPFKNVVDNLIHDQIIEPVIVVFIPHMEREKEYCYQDTAYSKVIAEEMVPFISENYSTKKVADQWGIMGSSMGGNISMVTGFPIFRNHSKCWCSRRSRRRSFYM